MNLKLWRRAPQVQVTLAPTARLLDPWVDNYSGDRSRITIGEHTYVRSHLLVFPQGGEIHIGEWSYVGHRSEIWSAASVRIGDRVLIAHDVNIVDTTAHSRDATERHEHYRRIITAGHPTSPADLPGVTAEPIVIEDDVWISFGVTILKGVRIGSGSVIAAGSIVAHDVPPRSFYRMDVRPIVTPL